MQLGYIGLGKMGLGQVERLCEKGWRVVAYNRSPEPAAGKAGAILAKTLPEVALSLKVPRLIWLMVPHAAVDEVLQELLMHLSKGDTVIDGGNSLYTHSMRRSKELAKKGINFLDVGTSGGPAGARNGACLMIGGELKVFKRYEKLFKDLAAPDAHAYFGKAGAGHFVKMVHNGIEYGMMQAIGEGFDVMKRSDFKFSVRKIAELYNKGSVIESRLIGWLKKAFDEHGENLAGISGEVSHSGEGLWTVKTAKELGVPVKVIKDSFDFRVKSKGNPSFTGQVVSALRNQFGGHSVSKKETS
jgi:6-phosphogluconate dehydrogenase